MTEKRYYAHKHLIKEDKVHDKICHRFMNITKTVEHMNMYYQKYTALKKENEQLKKDVDFFKGYREDVEELTVENEQLKQVLGGILIEVRKDISATNHSGEVKAFVNPNSFDLISDVLKKYGALKD